VRRVWRDQGRDDFATRDAFISRRVSFFSHLWLLWPRHLNVHCRALHQVRAARVAAQDWARINIPQADSGYSSAMSNKPTQHDGTDVVMQETDQNVTYSPDRSPKRKADQGVFAGFTALRSSLTLARAVTPLSSAKKPKLDSESALVELKGNKLVFKQKPLALDRQASTLKGKNIVHL
jgi:hypothetical protein